MFNNKTIKLSALAIGASLVLAACGGGGGGNNTAAPATGASAPTGASTPVVDANTNIAPQTSVPAPTYDSSSGQSGLFFALNSYRSNMGVGMMSQSATLDNAAQAHALYEQVNVNSRAETALTHTENSANPSFFEATPYQRAIKAGSPSNMWVGEVIDTASRAVSSSAPSMDGAACAQVWLNSVYHLQGATANQTTVGIGYTAPVSATAPLYYCVADFGVVSMPAPASVTDYNSIAYDGGQQIPIGAVVHAPYSGETNVALAMQIESPNPAPDLANPGRPIMVRVNEQSGNVLTVSSFQLTDASGAVVAARIIVPPVSVSGSVAGVTGDLNNELESGVAFLLPLAPLKPNTVYTVTFTGKRDTTALAATWQFSTAGN